MAQPKINNTYKEIPSGNQFNLLRNDATQIDYESAEKSYATIMGDIKKHNPQLFNPEYAASLLQRFEVLESTGFSIEPSDSFILKTVKQTLNSFIELYDGDAKAKQHKKAASDLRQSKRQLQKQIVDYTKDILQIDNSIEKTHSSLDETRSELVTVAQTIEHIQIPYATLTSYVSQENATDIEKFKRGITRFELELEKYDAQKESLERRIKTNETIIDSFYQDKKMYAEVLYKLEATADFIDAYLAKADILINQAVREDPLMSLAKAKTASGNYFNLEQKVTEMQMHNRKLYNKLSERFGSDKENIDKLQDLKKNLPELE